MSATEALSKFPLVFSRLDGSISTTPTIVDYRHPNTSDYISTEMFSIHRSAFINVLDDKANIKEIVKSMLDGSTNKSKISADEVNFLAKSLGENYKHVKFYLICSVLLF